MWVKGGLGRGDSKDKGPRWEGAGCEARPGRGPCRSLAMDGTLSPPNSCVEALTLSATVGGEGAFRQ